jgi:hypothetical protein
MTIQSEITKKDYSKLMTTHLLKTPYMIMIVVLGLAFLVFYFQNPELGQFYLFLGLGFIGLPVLTFFTIAQAYDKNKHFNEKLEFTIEDNNLELVGRTFRSSFTWDQITKVKESDKFFSLYQGRVLLTLINKENNDKGTVDSLRQFLKDKKKM